MTISTSKCGVDLEEFALWEREDVASRPKQLCAYVDLLGHNLMLPHLEQQGPSVAHSSWIDLELLTLESPTSTGFLPIRSIKFEYQRIRGRLGKLRRVAVGWVVGASSIMRKAVHSWLSPPSMMSIASSSASSLTSLGLGGSASKLQERPSSPALRPCSSFRSSATSHVNA